MRVQWAEPAPSCNSPVKVPEGGAVVVAKLENDGEEKEESAANGYAVSLLTGQPDFGMSTSVKMSPAGWRNRLMILAKEIVSVQGWQLSTGGLQRRNGLLPTEP